MKVVPITLKNKNHIRKEQIISVGNNINVEQMTKDYQKAYMQLLTNNIKSEVK